MVSSSLSRQPQLPQFAPILDAAAKLISELDEYLGQPPEDDEQSKQVANNLLSFNFDLEREVLAADSLLSRELVDQITAIGKKNSEFATLIKTETDPANDRSALELRHMLNTFRFELLLAKRSGDALAFSPLNFPQTPTTTFELPAPTEEDILSGASLVADIAPDSSGQVTIAPPPEDHEPIRLTEPLKASPAPILRDASGELTEEGAALLIEENAAFSLDSDEVFTLDEGEDLDDAVFEAEEDVEEPDVFEVEKEPEPASPPRRSWLGSLFN